MSRFVRRGRHRQIRQMLGAALAMLSCGASRAATPAAPTSTVVGRLDVTAPLLAADSSRARRLFVWLPADYDSTHRYPVLYMPNGQDLFDTATAAGGEEWGIDELLAARPAGIPELIVVGIEAAPHAIDDYAPPGSRDGASGAAYVDFLTTIVKPYVDRHYATRAEPDWTWIAGDGSGAAIVLYAAWTHADVFGAGIALSVPDLDRAALAWARVPPANATPRLWIDQLGSGTIATPSTTDLYGLLSKGARVQFHIAGSHTYRLVRLATALRSLAAP